jgi:hypothetical protein
VALALDFWWMRDYAAHIAGGISWSCIPGECSTDDPRSLIPVAGWAIVVVAALFWLAMPGAGFFPGIAFIVFSGALATGHAEAATRGLATDGTRINGIVAACIGAVLMAAGIIITAVRLLKHHPSIPSRPSTNARRP